MLVSFVLLSILINYLHKSINTFTLFYDLISMKLDIAYWNDATHKLDVTYFIDAKYLVDVTYLVDMT